MLAQINAGCYQGSAGGTRIVDQAIEAGGRPGWIRVSRIPYRYPGLRARSSTTVAAVLDTGRTRPAIFVAAVPDTHDHLLPDLTTLISSLQPVAGT